MDQVDRDGHIGYGHQDGADGLERHHVGGVEKHGKGSVEGVHDRPRSQPDHEKRGRVDLGVDPHVEQERTRDDQEEAAGDVEECCQDDRAAKGPFHPGAVPSGERLAVGGPERHQYEREQRRRQHEQFGWDRVLLNGAGPHDLGDHDVVERESRQTGDLKYEEERASLEEGAGCS